MAEQNTDEKDLYDYLVETKKIDPTKFGPDTPVVAGNPGTFASQEFKDWRAKKTSPAPAAKAAAEPVPDVASMPADIPASPAAKAAIDTASTAKPGQPIQSVVAPPGGAVKPGDEIAIGDNPAAKSIKTETALPQPIAPTTYTPPKKTPDFWEQASSVSKGTGRSIIQTIGALVADVAAGYTGKETPTALAKARKHEELMEGKRHLNNVDLANLQNTHAENLAAKAVQAQKDLEAIKDGFDVKKQALDRALNQKLATEANELTKQRITQEYNLQKQTLDYQQQIALLTYQWTHALEGAKSGSPDNYYGW